MNTPGGAVSRGAIAEGLRRPTLLLADDHTIVMEGLKKLLDPHFEIGGSVSDGRELLGAAMKIRPDVILLDISMPGLSGIEAARQVRERLPESRIIFLTMHADPIYLSGAFQAGARGYVLKRCASAELVHAIHEVFRGKTFVSPEIVKDLAIANPEPGVTELTPRERDVLQLVASGMSAKEIASALKISPKTVTFHKSNIMHKLGIRTTAGLTKLAVRRGLAEA